MERFPFSQNILKNVCSKLLLFHSMLDDMRAAFKGGMNQSDVEISDILQAQGTIDIYICSNIRMKEILC